MGELIGCPKRIEKYRQFSIIKKIGLNQYYTKYNRNVEHYNCITQKYNNVEYSLKYLSTFYSTTTFSSDVKKKKHFVFLNKHY